MSAAVCLQGEERAALNLASFNVSKKLTLRQNDMILYTAKVIPGNDKRVTKMFNRIAHMGATIANNRADGLHTRHVPSVIQRSLSVLCLCSQARSSSVSEVSVFCLFQA